MNKKNIKNKLIGVAELLVAFWFLVEGGWLYTKVSGTNLLFVDANLGKVAAYYWIFLLLGFIVGILGVITIRKKISAQESELFKKELDEKKEEVKQVENVVVEETLSENISKEIASDLKEMISCPACGATIEKGKKFCTSCGKKLEES